MARWHQGEAEIEALVQKGHLQLLAGSQANGTAWLDRARNTIGTAATIASSDPSSGFVLGYDAARYACTGLLVQQGLRPTSDGGHVAVERAVRAQFGKTFHGYGALRRRRNELEYPSHPDDLADVDEVLTAIEASKALIDATGKLLPHLGFFDRS
jgi:hypothetical protein